MPTTALIVAAGAGLRMGRPSPKAFLKLAGRPLVEHSLAIFEAHPHVDRIVLMVPPESVGEAAALAKRYPKTTEVAAGGRRRQDTVRIGLSRLGEETGARGADLVLVHDAARPLLEPDLIDRVIDAAARTGAAMPAIPPADTVRENGAGPAGAVVRLAGRTLQRSALLLAQTPQAFRRELLIQAYSIAGDEEFSDDAAIVQRAGHPVEVVAGSARNFKVTTPADLEVAEAVILARGAASVVTPPRPEGT